MLTSIANADGRCTKMVPAMNVQLLTQCQACCHGLRSVYRNKTRMHDPRKCRAGGPSCSPPEIQVLAETLVTDHTVLDVLCALLRAIPALHKGWLMRAPAWQFKTPARTVLRVTRTLSLNQNLSLEYYSVLLRSLYTSPSVL